MKFRMVSTILKWSPNSWLVGLHIYVWHELVSVYRASVLSISSIKRIILVKVTLFGWLWLVTGADLLWEKSTADWLITACWCWFGVRKKYCWLVEADRVSSWILGLFHVNPTAEEKSRSSFFGPDCPFPSPSATQPAAAVDSTRPVAKINGASWSQQNKSSQFSFLPSPPPYTGGGARRPFLPPWSVQARPPELQLHGHKGRLPSPNASRASNATGPCLCCPNPPPTAATVPLPIGRRPYQVRAGSCSWWLVWIPPFRGGLPCAVCFSIKPKFFN